MIDPVVAGLGPAGDPKKSQTSPERTSIGSIQREPEKCTRSGTVLPDRAGLELTEFSSVSSPFAFYIQKYMKGFYGHSPCI